MSLDLVSKESVAGTKLMLNFSLRTVGEWRELLQRTPRTPWTQTFQYASALAKVAHQSTRFATIERDQEIIGLVAVQELKFGPIHQININRGPLWFKGFGGSQDMKGFLEALKVTFPKRFLRRLTWMPEWSFSEDQAMHFLEETGLQRTKKSFETLWMDISPEMEVLKKRLHRKWRNHLHKAERSSLEVAVDFKGTHLDYFLRAYDLFKAQKKFEGPDGNFFKHEIEAALPFKDAIILWARLDGVPVAGVVVMKHGNSASYRVSWNTKEGRRNNAHFLLLWKAIEILKKLNVVTFDLGGILPDDNDGLNIFKLGMNGERFKTGVLK